MIGRADRGLVITTGTFSRDARAEATRDGTPPSDPVDGEQLLDKRRERPWDASVIVYLSSVLLYSLMQRQNSGTFATSGSKG
jgi:hypothetical protein